MKKELTEQLRTGKLTILGLVFLLFGVMNPAVAKLTPWLMEMMADTLEGSGLVITQVTVTAMDSWVQFFKNIPMALIVFVLLEGSIFTREYRSGTLILSLSKGLPRHAVVLSKTAVTALLWSGGYWLCFGVTYAYNAYFWDNAIARHLGFSAVVWWLFGLWVLSLVVLFSVLSTSGSTVLTATGGVVFGAYLLGMIPKLRQYLPTALTDGNSLIYGMEEPRAYAVALAVTAALTLLCTAVSVPIMNKRQI
jgi:ABC-2 type transport system permease protein